MSQGGGRAEGAEMTPILMALAVLILLVIFYHFFQRQIVHFLFFFKLYELKMISWFAPSYQSLISWIEVTQAQEVKWQDVLFLSKDVGFALEFPVILICLVLAGITYFFHPDQGYNTVEDMQSLIEKVHDYFPAIEVVRGLDLVKQDIAEGPWAMALSPVEFGRVHKLLSRDPQTGQVVVDKVRAKSIFASQIGRPWAGIEDLHPHEKAIFAALAAYVSYDRKTADKLLEQMAMSATQENLRKKAIDYSGVDALLKKYGSTPAVESVIKNHGFVYSVFTGMLETARQTGIVANSMYLWLKPIDRSLWYTLNNVGRRAVFSEMAGVHAHYLAEKAVGFAIKTPMVDEAVIALEVAISERIIRNV